MRILAILLFLIALSLPLSAQEPENYCLDPQTWVSWDEMAKKYPDDDPLQILHALRIGLCIKIEQGTITLQDATDLMNDYSDIVINERAKK